MHGILRTCPGRSAARSDALKTRDPVGCDVSRTEVPHLWCTAIALHHVRDTRPYFFNPFSSTNALQRLTSPAMYFVSAVESASMESSALLSNICLVSGAAIRR